MLARFALVLVFLAGSACSSTTSRPLGGSARSSSSSRPEDSLSNPQPGGGGERYRVKDQQEGVARVGDRIVITDSINKEVLTLSKSIDLDGTILLPDLGAFAVAGYTAAELEKLLAEKYAPYFTRLDVHVQIEHESGFEVLLTQGPFSLDTMSESNGILETGQSSEQGPEELLQRFLERFRNWFRETFLCPPILIVGNGPR